MITKSNEIPVLIRGHWAARGLVGMWPMMPYEVGGNKILDLSGNGNNGILAGSAPWKAGKFGPAPHYDGSSGRHKVAYSSKLYCGNYMTVSFWAKSDITNYTSNAYVISMWDYANNDRMWGICIFADVDDWTVITSDNGVQNNTAHTGQTVDTALHMITFVIDNPNHSWAFYYDGRYINTVTPLYTYTNQGSFLTIAGLDASNFFDGILDLLKIYNRASSASEVALLYREQLCMFERDPIELWSAATIGALPGVAPTGNIWGPLGGCLKGVA